MKLDAPRSPAKLASSSSQAPTFHWDVGSGGVLRMRALKPVADADGGFFAPGTSCGRGPTGCWSESAARTGKSRYAGLALISTASKPCFEGTLSYEMSPQWHGRVALMTRRPSSHT